LKQVQMSVAVCCSVLQCVAVWCSVVQCGAVRCSVVQCSAVWCSVVQCGAVCCSVLQSALQCVTEPSISSYKFPKVSCHLNLLYQITMELTFEKFKQRAKEATDAASKAGMSNPQNRSTS